MGSFSDSIGRRLRGLPARPGTQPSAADSYPAGEFQQALPDGRKIWVRRVPRAEWAQLPAGTELLLVRTKNRHKPGLLGIEMATLEQNALAHPAAPCLALAWGWLPEGESDKRPATILLLRELHVLLSYQLRPTAMPDVMATITPSLN